MDKPTFADIAAKLPKPPAPETFGFLKVDVPRCTTTTAAGKPCKSPRVKGTSFCRMHQWMEDAYPEPHQHPTDPATEPGVEIETVTHGTMLGHQRRHRKDMIEAMRETADADPRRIFAPLFEGLKATRYVWDNEQHHHVETSQPDWDVRFAAFDRIADRLYGKPKTRQEVTGAEGGPINIAAIVATAVQFEAAAAGGDKTLEAYYTSMPDGEEPIDVGPGQEVPAP